MDSSNPILHHDDHLSSVRRRNKILIVIFFSLIILLALIIGGIIISLVQKINSESPISNRAIREFCSPSEFRPSCIAHLSSQIKTPSKTNPNHIFKLSVEASLTKLSKITSILSEEARSGSTSGNCPSMLGHATGQLSKIVAIVRVDPDVETYERGNMTAWMTAAANDMTACLSDLGKAESTAADWVRMEVVEVRAVVAYSKDFLVNCESVNGNFRFVFGDDRSPWDEIVENLITVSLFGSQYFVLVLLFCLLLRIY